MNGFKVKYNISINGSYYFYGDNNNDLFIQEQIAEEVGIPLEYINNIEYTLEPIIDEN